MQGMTIRKLEKNKKAYNSLINLINKLDKNYIPPISNLTDIEEYCKKLIAKAIILIISIDNKDLGLIAFYANDQISKTVYISSIGLAKEIQNQGLGKKLLEKAIIKAKKNKMRKIQLEVNINNNDGLNFYINNNFKKIKQIKDNYVMERII